MGHDRSTFDPRRPFASGAIVRCSEFYARERVTSFLCAIDGDDSRRY